jgi:SAM-dependent methyltransferase
MGTDSAAPDGRFADTARAFDSVAADYDGAGGNNALVQIMRAELWRAVTTRVPSCGRLLDLGCGTGIDAEYFAQRGYAVCATDWSPNMVTRTRQRAQAQGLHIQTEHRGIQELSRLAQEPFDALYSDLGPLNCVPELATVAEACTDLLRPGGWLFASVIGRRCPWEFFYYAARGDWARARLRGAPGAVPVNLNHETMWTRYYRPSEFYAAFAHRFELVVYRSLNLFLPPPYLIRWYERLGPIMGVLRWCDARLDALPLLREVGDHFLMTLRLRT